MTDIQKVALGYVSALCSVLIGYWLTTARANWKARRDHKTQLRLLHASLPTCRHEFPTKHLDEWWLRAFDDCGWWRKLRIRQHISAFHRVQFPRPDWDANNEDEWTDERTARLNQQRDEANRQAARALERILNAL